MVACAVNNCRVKSGQGFAMFKFPDSEKDSERRKQWIDSIKLVKIDYEPTSFARVCERHFQNDQFVVDPSLAVSIGFQQKKLRLKENAVPTIFTSFEVGDRIMYKNRNGVKKPKGRPRKRKKYEESEDSDTCSSSDTEPYDPTDYSVLDNDPEQLTGSVLDSGQNNSISWIKSKKGILKKVICALARKNAAVAPTFVEKRNLAANGLGDKVVEFPEEGSEEEVRVAILREFPQLVLVGGFDFVCTQGKTRHLFHIENLDVKKLFSLKPGDGNLYARPKDMDIDIDKNLVYEKEGGSSYGVCQICGKSLPLDGIENHVKHCRYFVKEKQEREEKNRNKVIEKKTKEPNDIGIPDPVVDVSGIKQENPGSIIVEFKPTLQTTPIQPKLSYGQVDNGVTPDFHPEIKSYQSLAETEQVTKTETDKKLDDGNYEKPKVYVSPSIDSFEKEMLLTLKDTVNVQSLGLNLYQLQRQGVSCDLLLSGKDNCAIFAHKVVFLASESPFLKEILLQSEKNNKNNAYTIINFPLYSYPVLETLVRYVYTREILVPIDCADSFFLLCGSLKFNRAQVLMKPYLKMIVPKKESAPLPVTSAPDEKKITVDQTTRTLPLRTKKVIFNPPKKLSEKLRDIMQKNEELFNDVGINNDIGAKLMGKDQDHVINSSSGRKPTVVSLGHLVKSPPTYTPPVQGSVVHVLNNAKEKTVSSCHMFVKTSSFNSDISDDTNNGVSDNDITIKSEPLYAVVENVESGRLDTNQFLSGTSSDKFLTSADYGVSLKTTSPRTSALINDDQIESEFIETSSDFHGDYDPNIVIKTEPPCDYEEWQNKHSLGLDLPVVPENNESLGNVTIKEEPMT